MKIIISQNDYVESKPIKKTKISKKMKKKTLNKIKKNIKDDVKNILKSEIKTENNIENKKMYLIITKIIIIYVIKIL